MLDSVEYIIILSFDRSTILSQVWSLDWWNLLLQCQGAWQAIWSLWLPWTITLSSEWFYTAILFYLVSNFVFLISQICLDCSKLFFEKMMYQVNFIIRIDTYTSELKSKPLMLWLIGSPTPEFNMKFNVLKEQ